jgi:hypothetical protein
MDWLTNIYTLLTWQAIKCGHNILIVYGVVFFFILKQYFFYHHNMYFNITGTYRLVRKILQSRKIYFAKTKQKQHQ